MANIIVTATPVDVNVSTTLSNVTVTDTESNAVVNVTVSESVLSVTNNPINVSIAPSIGVSNSEVRAALGATSPILYDVSTGIFSFDADAAFDNAKVIAAIQSGNVTLKQVQETYFDVGNITSTTMNLDVANGTIQKVRLQSNVNQISFSNLVSGGSMTVFIEQDAFGFRTLDTTTNFNNWVFVDNFKTLSVGAGNVDALSVVYNGSTYFASLTRFNASDIDAVFDNVTVNFNTVSNTVTTNSLTVNGNITTVTNINSTDSVTANILVANVYAEVGELRIGKDLTSDQKAINAYGVEADGQLVYDPNQLNEKGTDGRWFFSNDIANTSFPGYPLPTSTTDLAEGSNLYFTAARSRGNVSVTDTGGDGSLSYDNVTGVFTYTGPNQAEANARIAAAPTQVRAHISAVSPITYSNSTGVIGLSSTANITTSGNIQGNYFLGNGSLLTGLPVSYSDANVVSLLASFGSNVINTTGNVAAGNILAQNIVLNPAFTYGNAVITTDAVGDRIFIDADRVTIGIDRAGSAAPDKQPFVIVNSNTGNVLLRVDPDLDILQPFSGTRVAGDLYVGTVDPSNVTGTYRVRAGTGDVKTSGGVEADQQITSNSGGTAILAPNGNIQGQYFIGNGSLLTGMLTNAAVIANIAASPLTVGGNLTVNGNINATGNINVQNVEDLYVRDQTIVMNANAVSPANVQIVANRPGEANTEIKWNEQADRWTFTNDGTTYYNLPVSTDDIAEGSNLYYSNARVNAFIQDNITTSDIDEGTNLYFTAERARGNISAGENITYNSTTGTIGMANALANVNSITAESATSFTINTNGSMLVRQPKGVNNTLTPAANVVGEGYALMIGNSTWNTAIRLENTANADFIGYFIEANVTTGSNALVISSISDSRGSSATVSDIRVGDAVADFLRGIDSYPFPPGTYVTSVDAPNSTIIVNTVSSATLTDVELDVSPAMVDSTTGLVLRLVSQYDISGGNAKVIAETYPMNTVFGYPEAGPGVTDFDIFSVGSSSDYVKLTDWSPYLTAKTSFTPAKTPARFDDGILIGSANPTNRGEQDQIKSWGMHMLWDGTANTTQQFGDTTIFPQMLFRQYSDGTALDSSLNRSQAGPRLFFSSANGKITDDPFGTYPVTNQELGRISWWGTSGDFTGMSTTNPPAYISALAANDWTTQTVDNINIGFAATSNKQAEGRVNYLSFVNGELILSSGRKADNSEQQKIRFVRNAGVTGTNSNINNLPNIITGDLVNISFANTVSRSGSLLSITNGAAYGAGTVGDMAFTLNRLDNSFNANTTITAVTTVANFIPVGISPRPADALRFPTGETFAGYTNGDAILFTGFTGTTGDFLNGNVFYASTTSLGGFPTLYLYTDSGLTTPLLTGIFGNQFAGAGTGEYTQFINSGVTAKLWDFTLPEQSNNLVIGVDGVTHSTFYDNGNLTVVGDVTANSFIGDGSGLTNVVATANTFDTIIVSGQSDVVAAGSSNLTLIAGSGMVITTDAGNDSITFESTGGYGDAEVAAFLAAYGSNTITTTGNITAGTFLGDIQGNFGTFSGNVGAQTFIGSGVEAFYGTFTGNVAADTFLGDVEGGYGTFTGNVAAQTFLGNIEGGYATLTGNVNAFAVNANTVVATDVYATNFYGEGSNLTDVKAKTINEAVKNVSGVSLPKGTPVTATGGVSGFSIEVVAADAGNAALMPAIGVLAEAIADDAEGNMTIGGSIIGVDTSGLQAGETVYVAVGGGWANVAPTGEANIVQELGFVTRVDVSNGGGIVELGSERSVPNLNSGNIFIGDSSNVPVTKSLTAAITDANVTLKRFQETTVSLGNVTGDISANIDVANGTIFTMSTTGNITINSLNNASAGTSATLIITNGGSHTLTSSMKFAGGSKTLSTGAGNVDIVSVFYDGSSYYATLSKDYK
jgi:hypothetical protein